MTMRRYNWATPHISYDEDSRWCQEHGHTGLLVGSVCDECDRLMATDPAFARLLGTVHNADGSRRRDPYDLPPLPRPLPPGIGVWLSPNGVEHAIVDGRCATCGRNHLPMATPHPTEKRNDQS
jgi:hypothetical protein